MARSTFYYHVKQSDGVAKYEMEKIRIQEIFQESKGRYGYHRITLQLCNDAGTGYKVSDTKETVSFI